MAEYVPPPNFVGEVSFAITLLVGTGAGCTPAAACTGDPSPRREQATLQSTVTSSYAFATCMEDTAFCGEHGTCQGPSGCLCQEHWFGVQCTFEASAQVRFFPSLTPPPPAGHMHGPPHSSLDRAQDLHAHD
jgi:hypothetical protein